MKLTKGWLNILVASVLLIGALATVDWLQTGITGFAVYESKQLLWDFDSPGDYSYDAQTVNISGGEAKLWAIAKSASISDAMQLSLPRGNNTGLAITEISDSKYKPALLKEGDEYYTDKKYEIETIPQELQGMLWLKTQQDDHDSKKNVSFTISSPARIFIGYDKRAGTIPDWMNPWAYWGEGITTENDKATPFRIYYRDFETGKVELGSNNKSKAMYVILANNTGYAASHEHVTAARSYQGKLKNITVASQNPGGTSVKLQIRTASTEQHVESSQWLGPTSTSDYYTSVTEQVNLAHDSSGWLQYMAVLETSSPASTPTLSSVTIATEWPAYPESSDITTGDYDFAKTAEITGITADHDLNGQAATYSYSTDSGGTWTDATLNSTMALKAGKIRLKTKLSSNTTHTPTVRSIEARFRVSVCDENWQAARTECGRNDTRVKYYSDANGCGSTEDLPTDNGTTESCDYCTPQWERINASCNDNDTLTLSYAYTNSCCNETGLDTDCTIPANATAKCDYCTPAFTCASYGECLDGNTRTCTAVNDSNGCLARTGLESERYTGNYTEFKAECAYDSEKPEISNVTAIVTGGMLTVTANITDKTQLNATARVIKDGRALINVTLANLTQESYTGTANVSALKGAYIITIAARDSANNTARKAGAAGFAIDSDKSAVREFQINGSRKALLRMTNSTQIELTGKASADAESIRLVVSEHSRDIKNTTKPSGRKEMQKYVELEAEDEAKSGISMATLRINYTNEEATALNISEATLTAYYYNETSTEWQQLNSTANTEQDYVEANTTHFSFFGIFGSEQNQTILSNATANSTLTNATNTTTINQTNSPATNATMNATPAPTTTSTDISGATQQAGTGQAGATPQTATEKNMGETSPDQNSEKQPVEEPCVYDVSVEMQGKASFINTTKINATLTNTGTCGIESAEVSVTPPLDSLIAIENGKAEALQPGKSTTFTLALKKAARQSPPLQGLAVKEPTKASTKEGKLRITGRGEKGAGVEVSLQFAEDVPLSVEVYEARQGRSKELAAAAIMATALLAAAATYGIARSRKRDRKEQQQAASDHDTGSFEDNAKKLEEKWDEKQNS